jgi:murein DD-endopeptidase MepM/ murein hydrolase activator NlpD
VKSSATRYARTHHHYPAADMFAPCGTAVVAPTGAVVEEIETRGDTGNAKGTGCHLHFGLSPRLPRTGWQNRRGKLAPQPYLDSWRKGVRNDPAPAIARMTCP